MGKAKYCEIVKAEMALEERVSFCVDNVIIEGKRIQVIMVKTI